ncbi:MAG: hypothetical protein ACM3U1_05805 [Chloroflexota bacterium]
MENSKIFIDFVEGNLDSEVEREFAGKFAYDADFRAQFRGFLTVTETIKKNTKAFAPSGAATNQIFAQLGYSVPYAATQVPSASVKFPLLSTRFLSYFLTGAGAAVLATLGVLLFLNPSIIKEQGSPKTQVESRSAFPSVKSEELPQKIALKSGRKEGAEIALPENAESASTVRRRFTPIEMISVSAALTPPAQSLRNQSSPLAAYVRPYLIGEDKNSHISSTKILGLSVEVRNFVNWNFPKETINPGRWNKLNNTSIAILYDLSNDLSVGAEARQETFFVKYTGNVGGLRYRYEQQPNLTSFSALGRLKLIGAGDVTGIAQVSLGANKVGYVARPMAGIQYKPIGNFSVVLGMEYSILAFYHQDKWFDASKLSLNYGINYKF